MLGYNAAHKVDKSQSILMDLGKRIVGHPLVKKRKSVRDSEKRKMSDIRKAGRRQGWGKQEGNWGYRCLEVYTAEGMGAGHTV